jgi:hypothetical protein
MSLTIFVEHVATPYSVDLSGTVRDLKRVICPDPCIIQYHGTILQDEQRLVDCGITERAIVQCLPMATHAQPIRLESAPLRAQPPRIMARVMPWSSRSKAHEESNTDLF